MPTQLCSPESKKQENIENGHPPAKQNLEGGTLKITLSPFLVDFSPIITALDQTVSLIMLKCGVISG